MLSQSVIDRQVVREPVVALLRVLERHARSHAGVLSGGTGRPQILLENTGLKRAPLLRIAVQVGEVST